jgi:hypothetical protein
VTTGTVGEWFADKGRAVSGVRGEQRYNADEVGDGRRESAWGVGLEERWCA